MGFVWAICNRDSHKSFSRHCETSCTKNYSVFRENAKLVEDLQHYAQHYARIIRMYVNVEAQLVTLAPDLRLEQRFAPLARHYIATNVYQLTNSFFQITLTKVSKI